MTAGLYGDIHIEYGIPYSNWTAGMIPLDPLPNLIDQVYARILEAIIDRTLPPGQRIRQNELAEKLGVSRQPVSHALHLLHRQGLVAESGRRGFEVTELNPARIRQLYEVRGAIDALAARLAAARVKTDAAGRAALEAALEAGRAIGKNTPLARLIALDVDFHSAIYRLVRQSRDRGNDRAAMAAYAPLDGDRAGRTRLPRQRLERARGDRRADSGRQCQGGGGRGISACADRGPNDRGTTEGDRQGGLSRRQQ